MSPRLLKLLLLVSLAALAGLGAHACRLDRRYAEARRYAGLGLESIRGACGYVAKMLEDGPFDEDRYRLGWKCIGKLSEVEADQIVHEFAHKDGPALARRIRERMRRGRLPAWFPVAD